MNESTIQKPKKSKRKQVAKGLIIFFSSILFILLTVTIILLVWSPGKIEPYRDAQGQILEGSIAEITKVEIGGIQQGMIIKSKSTDNPVLLFLHGGPGSPEYFFVQNSNLHLEDSFTVCWWDQRGSGMSFDSSIPADTMTLEQMMSDTVEVTNYLRNRFGQDKIYLMGHSWGSFLGVHTVNQHPELYHAYMGIGQVSNQLQSEKDAYDYMLKTAQATSDKGLVKKLGKYNLTDPASVNLSYLTVRSSGMNKQGIGIMHNMTSTMNDLVMPVLRCPEYTLGQKIGFLRGSIFSLSHLFQVVLEENLSQTVPSLKVPVYIFQGIYDYQVSYKYAKEYFDLLDAPVKKFYTFEKSAHSPLLEEPDKFMDIINKDVLGKT